MGAGEGPAAQPRRRRARPDGRHRLDVGRALPVPQLAHVEVAALAVEPVDALPAEEDVAGRLHQPLALDDALAVVVVRRLAPANGASTDGWASLACRNSGSPSSRPSSSTTQAPRADAADPDHLARDVDEAVAVEQARGGRRAGSRGRRRGSLQEAVLARCASPSGSRSSTGTISGGSLTMRGWPSTVCGELARTRAGCPCGAPWRPGCSKRLACCALTCSRSSSAQLRRRRPRVPDVEVAHARRSRRIALAVRRARPSRTPCAAACAAKPRSRPATAKLAASRLTSHSNGPGKRLVEVVEVEDERRARERRRRRSSTGGRRRRAGRASPVLRASRPGRRP